MKNEQPLSIARYVKSLPSSSAAKAYLCLDTHGLVTDSGGELETCGIPQLKNGLAISEQLPVIAQLLPLTEKTVVIANTQITEGTIIDLHLFADSAGQWVLIIDNTEAGIKLQSEQQERLVNDILEEKNTKSSKAG